jgi:predicted metalloprotease with PDZ domain
MKGLLAAILLIASLHAAMPLAAEEPFVAHELSFPRRENQYVDVRSLWPVNDSRVEFSLPSWTPGSYLIRDYASHLERMRAFGPDGESLPVVKTSKNRWVVETEGIDELRLEYEIWAGEPGVAESWVESDFALLNGAGIFLYTRASRKMPQQVTIRLPEAWSTAHAALPRLDGAHRFLARDYDELVDSPLVAGNTVAADFEVEGQPYSLVLSGENAFWDLEESVADMTRLVAAQHEFWGVVPFDRPFLFFNLFMAKFGGLEHDHSTVMMCYPWQMRDRKNYIKWLGLVSHEFFHAWNVRRMRPAALDEYDYDGETYTRELWLAEGLTSYYDNLLVFRAGLIDVADYFELLAEEIRVFETTPGREVRSAESASFDTWIKQYRDDDNKVNSTISYYRKGAVIGFVTDMAIRRETGNDASLDTVMRALYSRHGHRDRGQRGYPPGAFEDAVEAVAGSAVRDKVEEMLRSTRDPEIDAALDWYGLVLNRGAPVREDGGHEYGGAGVKWASNGITLTADQVLQGHAGADAGILPGDELLAIGGLRVTPENYQAMFQRMKPGEEVFFTLVRHERLITLPVRLGSPLAEAYAIGAKPRFRSREKARLQEWLGRELTFVK